MKTDQDLYRRSVATLLASWEEDARGSDGAALLRLPGVAAAVFPTEPERSIFNNALIDRNEPRPAIGAMESAYADAGVDRFAVWVHESDQALRAKLDARGYRIQETSRVMARSLRDALPDAPDLATESLPWGRYLDYLEAAGTPPGLLSGVDPTAYHVLGVEMAGQCVATAIAFDHDGDCGIFNASTLDPFRRRGIGTSLVARHLHDAARRGCATASLQATPIAERVYVSVGFRDLGRYLEYVPERPVADAGS